MVQRALPTLVYIVLLMGVAALGVGLLVWLAPVTAADMTPGTGKLVEHRRLDSEGFDRRDVGLWRCAFGV